MSAAVAALAAAAAVQAPVIAVLAARLARARRAHALLLADLARVAGPGDGPCQRRGPRDRPALRVVRGGTP